MYGSIHLTGAYCQLSAEKNNATSKTSRAASLVLSYNVNYCWVLYECLLLYEALYNSKLQLRSQALIYKMPSIGGEVACIFRDTQSAPYHQNIDNSTDLPTFLFNDQVFDDLNRFP